MKFFGKKKAANVFFLQQDGRLGDVSDPSSNGVLDTLSIGSEFGGRALTYVGPTFLHKRIRVVMILFGMCVTLFFLRSFFLQIIRGDEYAALAQENRYRTYVLSPARGQIFDRWGTTLASNEPAFTVTMTIADIPKDDPERSDVLTRVASFAGLQRTDIDLLISDYASRPYEPIPISKDVPYELAMKIAIEIATIPGFDLEMQTRRVYDSTALSLAHILGYTGLISASEIDDYPDYRPIDTIGKAGVEKTFESLLRGVPGKLVYEVDAKGNKLSVVSQTDDIRGADISLSIDFEFQKFIEQTLQRTMSTVGATKGCVIALDPQTGATRALVSLPAYDPNLFIGGIAEETFKKLLEDPDQPLFPRAIAGEYPSGSIFKPIVAYAALDAGIVGEHTSFLSTGGLRINDWFFPDWKVGGHGVTDVRKAISESVNTFFYIVGGGYDVVTGLGVEKINEYAKKFGFGSQTGIDLPGEQDGFLPTKEWKQDVKGERWYVGDTYHLAIGQGDFLTTPLQMAVATSILANGGYKFKPYLLETIDGQGNFDLSTGTLEPIEGLNTYAMVIVRQGMRQTVTSGSARSLSTLAQEVAGKTGTAQPSGDLSYHSWFTGFGPYSDPNIALVVLVEEGGESNDAAVPIARSIFSWWFANR